MPTLDLDQLKFPSQTIHYSRLKRILENSDWQEPVSTLEISNPGITLVLDGSHRCWIAKQLGLTSVEVVGIDEDNFEQRLPNTLQSLKRQKGKTKRQKFEALKESCEELQANRNAKMKGKKNPPTGSFTFWGIDDLIVFYPNWSSTGPVDQTIYETRLQELISNVRQS